MGKLEKAIKKETIAVVIGGFIVGIFVAPMLGAQATIGIIAGGAMVGAGLVKVLTDVF